MDWEPLGIRPNEYAIYNTEQPTSLMYVCVCVCVTPKHFCSHSIVFAIIHHPHAGKRHAIQ